MTQLDPTSAADRVVFGYLHGLGYTDKNFDAAGDETVAELGYWNPADPGGSQVAAQNVAIGIEQYALQNAPVFGTQWRSAYTSPAQRHGAVNALIAIAQDDTKTISDISAQINIMFQFH